ncbi:MAG: hypothetical protein ACYDB9_10305 [Gammaproteobacteria bacterium]
MNIKADHTCRIKNCRPSSGYRKNNLMTYYPDFFDAVRLTGHSCPTVARAFLMTRAALGALYADKLPVRGEIQVDFRDALLRFDTHIDGEIRFLRTDNSIAVTVTANLDRVPANARTRELLRLCLTGNASPEQQTDFRNLWQARVRTLLLECADDPAVTSVSRVTTAPTLDFYQGGTVAVGAS